MVTWIFIGLCVGVSLYQLRSFALDAKWHHDEVEKKFDIFHD